MSELIGRALGQYRIVEQIGQGGMATVFKAYQPNLERYVAIKVLPPAQASQFDFQERFLREARAIANLHHPNIVPVYDFGQEGEYRFIVMRYIEGARTLREVMTKALPLPRVVHLIGQIAAALETAHRQGIIHRDIKPSNVLMDGDWALLSDFGLARHVSGADQLTVAGMVMGTPAYMAPEQGQGGEVDHRADIYALGVILFEMVTGQIPHPADTPLGIITRRATKPPLLPRSLNPHLPEMVEWVILKSLTTEPDQRFASASALAGALASAVAERPPPGTEDPPTIPSSDPATFLSLPKKPPSFLSPTPEPPPQALPLANQLPVPLPSETTKGPLISHFVGRAAELAYYSGRLAATRLALITGMAGVGKTALAAKLAQQNASPERIYWQTLYPDSGVETILWGLAAFLACHGRVELWQMLQSARLTGGQPPPVELLFDFVVQALRGQSFILCLDDLHLLQDDPVLLNLLDRLQPLLQAAELALIVTSRQALHFMPAVEVTPLAGLSQADAARLLAESGLDLPAEQAAQLYQHTEGNAELLTLAAQILKQSRQPERVLARLAETDDIERYLIKEVDECLEEDDREIMIAVAILLGYPGTRDVVETVAERRRIKALLRHLVDQHLLNSQEGELDEEYSEHAIVRAFYYDVPGRRERQAMHRRAGAYYEQDEPDPLRAARHYEQAGDTGKATELITTNIWAVINRGEARPLRHLLERLAAVQLAPELAVRVRLALGEIYTLTGESQAARAMLQQALDQVIALPDTAASRILKARIYQGMGSSWRYEASAEALAWLRRALDVLAGADLEQEAGLRIEIGRCQIDTGEFVPALASLEQGLQLLPPVPSRLRATALLNIGNIYASQGNLPQADTYTRQAAEISNYLHDHYRMAAIWHNMGIDYESAGRWDQAQEMYQQALDKAERLGNIHQQVGVALSLGILKLKQGMHEAAEPYLDGCLALARPAHLNLYIISANASLANLRLSQGQPEAAAPLLAEAERLCQEAETQEPLPEIYREQAKRHHLTGELPTALAYIEQSLALATVLEMKLEEGLSRRVLGEIWLALAQPEAALAAFEQSLSLLIDSGDPYQVARTQAAWGRALCAGLQVAPGRQLLEEAYATFQRLGAQRDLAQAAKALAR